VAAGPWTEPTLASLGVAPDFAAQDLDGRHDPAGGRAIGWTHRVRDGVDLYYVSNQTREERSLAVSLRAAGRRPELWDPVTGEIGAARGWRIESGRTVLPLRLPPSGSIFIVLRPGAGKPAEEKGAGVPSAAVILQGPWAVAFDPASGGPADAIPLDRLASWSSRPEPGVRYYSGTATYKLSFTWTGRAGLSGRAWLDLGRVANLAEVTLNGMDCGVAWTAPYRVEITSALRRGPNELGVAVTNTWANRLIGDHGLPPERRITSMVAPYRLEGRPLLEAGLLGPVSIASE
jgi:hypothetical protein